MICNKQKHIRSDTSYATSATSYATSYVTTGSERTEAASEDDDLNNSEDEDLNSLREEALASRGTLSQQTESGDDNSEHDSGKSSNKI